MFFGTAAVLDPQADALRAGTCARASWPAWQAAGFQDIHQTTLAMHVAYADFDDLASYLGGQGPAAEYIAGIEAATASAVHGVVSA